MKGDDGVRRGMVFVSVQVSSDDWNQAIIVQAGGKTAKSPDHSNKLVSNCDCTKYCVLVILYRLDGTTSLE